MVVDVTNEFGYDNEDAIQSTSDLLLEIERYSSKPVIIFANKQDLGLRLCWDRTKLLYMQEVFSRSPQSENVSRPKQKYTAKSLVSGFSEFPREITMTIIMTLVALLYRGGAISKIDKTEDFRKLAQELNLPFYTGSALKREGIQEVFTAACLTFLETAEENS